MDLRTIMFLAAASGANNVPTVEATASGNPATFTTDVKKALAGLTIPFTPIQTGTGNPAPDNVREILGKSEIRISHSGEDTSNPNVVTVSLGDTFYGGSLDAATGILTVEYILVTGKWGRLDLVYSSETVVERVMKLNATVYGTADSGWVNTCFCDVAKPIWANQSNETPHFFIGYSNSYHTYCAYIYLPASMSNDATIKIAAKLKESITIQLDPVTITTLLGENNIWTDTNGSNTVTY